MSLWGDEFEVPSEKKEVKKVAKKVSSPKDPKVETRKAMKSKTVSTFDKLQLIYEEVNRVLGGYTSNTKVITSKDELSQYIDEAIRNGIIAIDTETNNSLEPLTCLLMGACIYTPGQLSAYIPVHHTQPDTDILIENQLTERHARALLRIDDDKLRCKVLDRIIDNGLNGKWNNSNTLAFVASIKSVLDLL